nr:rod shape-determining protein MreC [uncultured Umboniibacter sp.]
MFKRDAKLGSYLVRLMVVAVILLVVDKNLGLSSLRMALTTLSAPFYWLTSLPDRVDQWGDDNLVSRERLMAQNASLRAENDQLQLLLQRFQSVTTENDRLRQMMGASERLSHDVITGQLIGVSPDPVRQVIIVDKGQDDGVRIGLPVLDRLGVAGQVIDVSATTASILLLTDQSHALPVRFLDSGIRSVAEGAGDISQLQLLFVPQTSNVQPGDIIVTSGLGDVFPEGYPVGEVDFLLRDPNQPFMEIRIRPYAQLNRSRFYMILVPHFDETIVTPSGEAEPPAELGALT